MADLLKTTEVADLLGCTVYNVSRLAQIGQLPVARKDAGVRGARWFNRSDVEAFKATRGDA